MSLLIHSTLICSK